MQRKRRLAGSALWPMGDTSDDAAFLQRQLGAEASVEEGMDGNPVEVAMRILSERDGSVSLHRSEDGSYPFE